MQAKVSQPDVVPGFKGQFESILQYLSMHIGISLAPNVLPTHFLQIKQNEIKQHSPRRTFKPAAKRKKPTTFVITLHQLLLLECLTNQLISLPTSLLAVFFFFFFNYSMAFSRWRNSRSQRKAQIIIIHKLI